MSFEFDNSLLINLFISVIDPRNIHLLKKKRVYKFKMGIIK